MKEAVLLKDLNDKDIIVVVRNVSTFGFEWNKTLNREVPCIKFIDGSKVYVKTTVSKIGLRLGL